MLYFWVGVGSLALTVAELLRRSYLSWQVDLKGSGLLSFVIAFVLFLVAGGISAAKAGFGHKLSILLPTERKRNTRYD